MSELDDRRDQYVPLDSHIAFKRTGAALLSKWGPDGLLALILLLAAAKREPVQGTFTFASDSEAWSKIGFTPSGFTIDELLRVLGHRKQTSRRRHGHLSYVKFTQWERWNKTFKRREDAARKSSKRGASDPDTEQTESGQVADKNATEGESEVELEVEEKRPNGLCARRVFEHWQQVWNHPRSEFSLDRKRLILSRLKTYDEATLLATIDGSKIDALRWPDRNAPAAHKLSVIFRDADHIEAFAELAASPTSPNGHRSESEEDRERRLLARLNQLGPKEAA